MHPIGHMGTPTQGPGQLGNRKSNTTEAPMGINQLIEAEIPRLRRYALKLTRDSRAADDLVQECLVRALGKQHLWREGSNLRAWLCTILHNLHVNEIRRRVRQGSTVDLGNIDVELVRPPPQEKILELRDVRRVLAGLTREQYDAVILIGLGGWTYERTARATRVPIGTVRSRLSRGRQKLKLAA